MSDYSELKRLAEHHRSLGHAYTVATPTAVLALIAENERLVARDALHVQQFNELSVFRDRTVEEFDAKVARLETEVMTANKFADGLQEMIRRQNKTHCRLADEIKQLKKAARNV